MLKKKKKKKSCNPYFWYDNILTIYLMLDVLYILFIIIIFAMR